MLKSFRPTVRPPLDGKRVGDAEREEREGHIFKTSSDASRKKDLKSVNPVTAVVIDLRFTYLV